MVSQRDLDQGFVGREYILDARDTYDHLDPRSHHGYVA